MTLKNILSLGFVVISATGYNHLEAKITAVDFKRQDFNFMELHHRLGFAFPSQLKHYYQTIDKAIDQEASYRDVHGNYIDNRNIDGWFDKRLIILLGIINNFQQKNNISGNVAEIGVWQGRSFIPMALLTNSDENSLAVDCFESYEFNTDNSGGAACSFSIFVGNLTKYFSDISRLKIIKGDSSILKPDDFLKAVGNNKKFRIFSVDGCHEALPTEKDMENGAKCLVDGGVLIMDDYFNQTWPGVSEGVNRFMIKNEGMLKPFFIGWNKIFFAQPAYIEQYRTLMRTHFLDHDMTIKKYYDVETIIYDQK